MAHKIERVLIECETVKDCRDAQRVLIRKGYRWPGNDKRMQSLKVIEIIIEGRIISMVGSMVNYDVWKYAINNGFLYFYLPDEKAKFLESFGAIKKMNSIGQQIRIIRKAKGLTQFDLHRIAGVSKVYIQEIESCSGKSNPTIAMLNKIADALDARVAIIA